MPKIDRKVFNLEKLENFEKVTQSNTAQAAKLLGVNYPTYMDFRRGGRSLEPNHLACIAAHILLDEKGLARRKAEAKKVPR